ncbi:hypothetical protein RR48_09777 [Papilio machaon]|uniref:Integrase catalytic domain-containing protein n=1 Tax=Papilio machaon TaxID=76193 RepID=A0A194R3M4_PAPMA|nr:hypothetical protein RR48_09777 [Papilio machaon]
MHHSNGQAERYVRTVLNLIRVESNNKKSTWSDALCKIQIMLNITKQKTTQYSALYLLIGTNATTPIIHALVRDVAMENSSPNREATREISRSNAKAALDKNRLGQDARVNRQRHTSKKFQVNDQVFVIKYSQSGGKLDSGMRGPYRVTRILPNDRYEMKLLSGSRGKTTQAAAQYMVLWIGEWCPESCSAFFDGKVSTERFNVVLLTVHLLYVRVSAGMKGECFPCWSERAGGAVHASSEAVVLQYPALAGVAPTCSVGSALGNNPDDDDVGETSDRPADPASADTSPQTGNEQELAAVTNTT